jgi:hypothetical protein
MRLSFGDVYYDPRAGVLTTERQRRSKTPNDRRMAEAETGQVEMSPYRYLCAFIAALNWIHVIAMTVQFLDEVRHMTVAMRRQLQLRTA